MRRIALALFFLGAAVLAWRAAPTLHQRHLDDATGHPGTKSVSCGYCHEKVSEPSIWGQQPAEGPRYLSPEGLVVSMDNRSLFVVAEGVGRLLEIDLSARKVIRSVSIGGRPHSVAISRDGRTLAVSSRDQDKIVLLDTETLERRREMRTGGEPLGVALSRNGTTLFAAEAADNQVLLAGVENEEPFVHLLAGREPYAVALSRDESRLVVSNRLSNLNPKRDVPVSELTVIDAKRGRVSERRRLVSAHLSEGAAIASDGSFALAPVLRVRNLLPTIEVARGGLMNSALVFADLRPGGPTVQFPLDEANAFFADPAGVALTPDDRLAFVAHGGADVVAAVDVAALRSLAKGKPDALSALEDDLGASGRYVLARIPTLSNPHALAISPDGERLYVSERLADSIAIIDVRRLRLMGRIDLGGPKTLTALRRGERIFYDGRGTFQGQFSCRSCHPDGNTDALTWDFEIDGLGKEIVDSHPLRGIKDTAPFKWTGKNPTLARQCGPRFSRVLMRSDPFAPDQLADLVAYEESIPRAPRRVSELPAEAVERGRLIFYRTRTNTGQAIAKGSRCNTCHPPPLYTLRFSFDVGTGGKFDTPHLMGLRYTAPYLHDERAMSLEEIWTVHGTSDTHGVTNDMTKPQLNDLVTFLRSL